MILTRLGIKHLYYRSLTDLLQNPEFLDAVVIVLSITLQHVLDTFYSLFERVKLPRQQPSVATLPFRLNVI